MAKIDNCTKIKAVLLYSEGKYTLRGIAEGLGISKSSVQRFVESYKKKDIAKELGRCQNEIEWIRNTKISEQFYSAEEKKKDILKLEEEFDLLVELGNVFNHRRKNKKKIV